MRSPFLKDTILQETEPPSNPGRSTVNGKTVGYLSREDAARFAPYLERHGLLSCDVDIRGRKNFGAFFPGPLPSPES
jgi:hypothetical protein